MRKGKLRRLSCNLHPNLLLLLPTGYPATTDFDTAGVDMGVDLGERGSQRNAQPFADAVLDCSGGACWRDALWTG